MVLVGAACGERGRPAERRELLVSAASSLTDAFRDVEAAFEETSPQFDVVLNTGGSSMLREQILAGAPVDVFAPADEGVMAVLSEAGHLDGAARVFARSSMAIAVPLGNPAGVAGLEDLGRESLLVGLCARAVPCGRFARLVLTGVGVAPAVDTEEANVRALLTKVEEAELDVALVYVTDIASTGRVEGIRIPDHHNVVVEYPIAVVAGAPDPEGADAFISFVTSTEGRHILGEHGFSPP